MIPTSTNAYVKGGPFNMDITTKEELCMNFDLLDFVVCTALALAIVATILTKGDLGWVTAICGWVACIASRFEMKLKLSNL